MQPPEDSPSNSFRYFVVGVLCVAVLLGVYFVQFNAQVDREREAANQRLALCIQVESMARSVRPNSLLNSTHKCNAHPCMHFVRRLPAQALARA